MQGIQISAISSKWNAPDGRKAETVLFHLIMPNQSETTWWYETIIIEGKGKGFARTAGEMNTAILNIKTNPQWIQHTKQVVARQNAQAQQQQFHANQQRINNNQRNFEANQRAYVDANNAVNESQMSIYNTQSQASDRSQSQFVD